MNEIQSAAAAMGRKGGKSKSPRKQATARKNLQQARATRERQALERSLIAPPLFPTAAEGDLYDICAALRALGLRTRIEEWKDGETVELWAFNVSDTEGLKFTFKAGKLAELHARAADVECADQRWPVGPALYTAGCTGIVSMPGAYA
jgi:hypothetical protein